MNDTVKNIFLTIATFLVLMVIIFGSGWFLQAAGAQSRNRSLLGATTDSIRSVTVTGVAKVQAIADQALVRLRLESPATDAATGLDNSEAVLQSLLKSLEEQGLSVNSVQPLGVQIVRNETGDGYVAHQRVELALDDLQAVDGVLAAVQAAGQTVEEVRYTVSDTSELLEQARQQAMEDARHKAGQLAGLAQADLDEVLRIEENAQPYQAVQQASEGELLPQTGASVYEVVLEVTWRLKPVSTAAEAGTSEVPEAAVPATTEPVSPLKRFLLP